MERILASTAPERDQWEFDRQQNIIDTIEQNTKSGVYADESLELATAEKRRDEALAIQNYLIGKNLESEPVNTVLDRVDQDWVAENPPPPQEPVPDPKDGDDIGVDPQ